MSRYDPDLHHIGTVASLKPYRRVDSRACPRCGAVAGRCEHMRSDEDIIWISKSKEKPINPATAWSPSEKETAQFLYIERGLSFRQVADIMNKTEGSVAGMMRRMGVRKRAQ